METNENVGKTIVKKLFGTFFWFAVLIGVFVIWNRCGGDDDGQSAQGDNTENVNTGNQTTNEAEIHFSNPDQVLNFNATLFKNPWCTIESNAIDCLGLKGEENDLGDRSDYGAEGWVLFEGLTLKFSEDDRASANLIKSYRYRADACRSNPNREAVVRFELGPPAMYAMKDRLGVDWARSVESGAKFDLVMYEPWFSHKSPKSACEGTSTSVKTFSEGKWHVRPSKSNTP